VLAGLLVFIVVEKLFSLSDDEETDETVDNKVLTHLNSVNNNHKDIGKEINGGLVKATSHIQVNYAYYLY